jgi:hypothetical protein
MTVGLLLLGVGAVSFVVRGAPRVEGSHLAEAGGGDRDPPASADPSGPILFSRNVYDYAMLRSDRLGARREPVRFDAQGLPDDPLLRHIGYQD